MIQVRNNIFETNSSSTHAFAFYNQLKPEIDFENYEALIDYYHKDDDLDYPIHTFDDIESKLRYFYTTYCYEANPNDTYINEACKNFMEKIFHIFPKVKWVDPPQDQYEEALYMEDADYVFYDFDEFSYHDELHYKLTTEDDIKRFLQNGVIFFGGRDVGNYDHDPWDDVWEYNKEIEKITLISG